MATLFRKKPQPVSPPTHVGPGDHTKAGSPGGKHLYPPRRLTDPILELGFTIHNALKLLAQRLGHMVWNSSLALVSIVNLTQPSVF